MVQEYLISIDPSVKNTGITLWEKENITWKPVLILSFNFKGKIQDSIKWNNFIRFLKQPYYLNIPNKIVIEAGFSNFKYMKGNNTLDWFRGFICGQLGKLLTKDMTISNKTWKSYFWNKYIKINENYCKYRHINENKKWDKKISLWISKDIIKQFKWDLEINNHDEAESFLIGYYYIKEILKENI